MCFESIHNRSPLPGAPDWALELPRQPWDEIPSLYFLFLWHQDKGQGTNYFCLLTTNNSCTLDFLSMSRLNPFRSSLTALPGSSPSYPQTADHRLGCYLLPTQIFLQLTVHLFRNQHTSNPTQPYPPPHHIFSSFFPSDLYAPPKYLSTNSFPT